MESRRNALLLSAGAAALAVILFVVLGGGGSGSSSACATRCSFSFSFANDQPVGGVKDIAVNTGAQVTMTLHTDTDAELHVHTSPEHAKDIKAGGTGSVTFTANASGRYEVEAHPLVNGEEQAGVQLAELTVNP
jgi:hypothetical protein